LTVYRGHQENNREGWSWSTSIDVAKWFASRFSVDGTVVKTSISRNEILAYVGSRGEKEVIIDPETVTHWT